MSAMSAIDSAIERARASASRLQQAHQHSIRTGEGREIQRQAAEKAQAIVAELQEARGAVVEQMEALDECVDVLRGVDSNTGDPVDRAARRGRAALARFGGPA